MKLSGKITLASGFVFDYGNMINTPTVTVAAIEALQSRAAAAALLKIREQGVAKAHLSKDGTPEPVFLRNYLLFRKAILIHRLLSAN